MTTYQDRTLIRDELVTLFENTGEWVAVYGYYPAADVLVNTSPVLLITDGGTRQTQAGASTNPTAHRFILTTFVLAYDEASNWSNADAMDRLAKLDMVVRQTIRDNVSLTNADNIELDGGFSSISSVPLAGGVPYLTESRTVTAYLHRGAV